MARIEIIRVRDDSMGLMVVEQDRKIVAMIDKLPEAREQDTMIMMHEMKMAYARYLDTVYGYSDSDEK